MPRCRRSMHFTYGEIGGRPCVAWGIAHKEYYTATVHTMYLKKHSNTVDIDPKQGLRPNTAGEWGACPKAPFKITFLEVLQVGASCITVRGKARYARF